MSVRRYDTIALGVLKNKKKKEEYQIAIFYFAWCVRKLRYYGDVINIHSSNRKSAVERDGGV